MKQSTTVTAAKDWIEEELEGCHFKDERLHKRFGKLLERLSAEPEGTLPMACQDWANTKAAYRFFSNARRNGTRAT